MITIEPITKDDYGAISTLHETLLPWSFMANAGRRFLSAFYDVVMSSQAGFGYVAKEQGRVVGFALAVYDSRGLLKRLLLADFFKIIKSLLPVVIKSFSKMKTLLQLILHRQEKAYRVPSGECLFIAIDPAIKKGMTFFKLIYAIDKHFLDRGIKVYHGRVLNTNPVIEVFRRVESFQPVEEISLYGHMWTLYNWSIERSFKQIKEISENS
ncbi:MAG: hypothetical protein HQK88_12790 [Nitrospirae bacterium]|nr:hypothetical protein [Nitrospirota bacterium]MBF0519249.1 hypothetical protein [Nitrospirota bacterium]MBF0535781.1 hypothetical protein [Nitrospirota bacterium]MBF0617678.1 hypothetical protein [Nitrospirota bacterium]